MFSGFSYVPIRKSLVEPWMWIPIRSAAAFRFVPKNIPMLQEELFIGTLSSRDVNLICNIPFKYFRLVSRLNFQIISNNKNSQIAQSLSSL